MKENTENFQDYKNIKVLNNCKSIAILGGTFDPIHYAHLFIANVAKQEFNIDKVIFIPSGRPPHKQEIYVSSPEHRYNMTFLATLNNPDFFVSKIEIERQGLTYTIDTIKYLKDILPNVKIYFIIGTDTITQIKTWKNFEELYKLIEFIAVTRPKYLISDDLKDSLNNIHFLEIPLLDISSTNIKNRVSLKKPISYLLPKEVEEYIYKFDLYKDKEFFTKYNCIINKLKQNLNLKRFYHSIEVAKESLKLAKKYNYNQDEAFLAAILHDCAKCFSAEKKMQLCKKYNIDLNEILIKQIDLTHSFLGYFIAKDEYNISNENILNAIKYHTTGKKNMTTLEKIVYIADYIEPTRPYFEQQQKARQLAYEDLDKAMKFILKSTIDFNLSKNRLIHNLSIGALEFYQKSYHKI